MGTNIPAPIFNISTLLRNLCGQEDQIPLSAFTFYIFPSFLFLCSLSSLSFLETSLPFSEKWVSLPYKSLLSQKWIFLIAMALSIHLFLQKKSVLHLSRAQGTNRRGEEGEGATSPLPLLFPDHPSLPSPSPGPVRFDEIRSLERSEVIEREDC